jgi:tRNA(Ile)-lysidine synthase TilS/MesJ
MSAELCDGCRKGNWRHPIAFTGERLCDACFRGRFLERVKRTVSGHRLLTLRSKLTIGVSGSPQSLALAKVMWELEGGYRDVAVSFVHVLRWGDMEEANAIRSAFAQLHLPLERLRAAALREKRGFCLPELLKEDVIPRSAICRACRSLVRSVLTIEAVRGGSDVLVLGDTADELAEEALFMLSSGLAGRIRGIEAKRPLSDGQLHRALPLSHVLSSEAVSYLSSYGFSPSYSCAFKVARKGAFSGLTAPLEAKRPGSAFSAIKSFLDLSEALG